MNRTTTTADQLQSRLRDLERRRFAAYAKAGRCEAVEKLDEEIERTKQALSYLR